MVKIYVTVFSRPEFIQIQYNQLKKYCRDDFEYIVINNSKNDEIDAEIVNITTENSIRTISVVKDHKIPNVSHFNALNTAFNVDVKNKNDNDLIVVMDSDVFPFKSFSFKNIIGDSEVGGIYQQRQNTEIEYLCPIFTILTNKVDLSDIDFSWKVYTDCGGSTDNFIKSHNLTPKWVDHTAAIDIETGYIFVNNNKVNFPYKKEYRSQFIAGSFFHYYRGCNWDEQQPSYHEDKFNFLKYFLENTQEYVLNLDPIVHYDKAHAEKGWEGKDHNYKNYRYIYI